MGESDSLYRLARDDHRLVGCRAWTTVLGLEKARALHRRTAEVAQRLVEVRLAIEPFEMTLFATRSGPLYRQTTWHPHSAVIRMRYVASLRIPNRFREQM